MRNYRDKWTLEERYWQREEKSIERSRKTIRMEKERLEMDASNLPQPLCQEIEQDLRVLTQELQARESALEARKSDFKEKGQNLPYHKRRVEDEENPRPSFWEKPRTWIRKAVVDSSYDRFEKVFISLIVCIQMAALVSIVTLILQS